ncbi:L-rhamnose mutarotase [Niabella insulamsoli]|uniref:L-rhamnose mutarotase n=1 Tax=Niabella insulamsoli TaxID=3144874 RepID=UPI0031FCC6B6
MNQNKTRLTSATFFYVLAALVIFSSCKEKNTVRENDVPPAKKAQRYAMVTGLNPEKEAYYRQLHADAWQGVLDKIKACHIENYSIYLKEIDGRPYLFSYFEYVGNDFEGDMQKMSEDSITQRWWKETDPCQVPLPDAAKENKIWSPMEEVFHTD